MQSISASIEGSLPGNTARLQAHTSPLSEIALVLVRFDYVARIIVNANHSVMRTAEKLCITDCIADCVRRALPQTTEWQRIGNQINPAMIFTRADFVNVCSAWHSVEIQSQRAAPAIRDLANRDRSKSQ